LCSENKVKIKTTGRPFFEIRKYFFGGGLSDLSGDQKTGIKENGTSDDVQDFPLTKKEARGGAGVVGGILRGKGV